MRNRILPPGTPKVIHSLIDDGIAEVPLVGVNNLQYAKVPLVEHTHPGLMEISYLRSGQMFWSVGEKEYVHRGNEVFVTYPDEIHGTGKRPQGKGFLYWMQVQLPKAPQRFLGLSAQQAAPLIDGLWSLQGRHFRGRRELQILFEEIIDLHLQSQLHDALHTLAIASRVQAFLLAVLTCSSGDSPSQADLGIQRVIERIRKNPTEKISPRALAKLIGLSASSFNHRFKEQTGMPPGQYILHTKVDHARSLLEETDLPVTEIAHRLGFSSSQYFATVFKRYTHMTPRDVRAIHRRQRHRAVPVPLSRRSSEEHHRDLGHDMQGLEL